MTQSIVLTFIGADKPGMVGKLSRLVAEHHGNWLESRMSQLAGQFAGIIRIAVADEHLQSLRDALQALNGDELTVHTETGGSSSNVEQQELTLSILGNDRPGIVREVSAALAAHHINVVEMNTNVSSAPMSAEPLFAAETIIQIPDNFDRDRLEDELDEIANDLTVDITLA